MRTNKTIVEYEAVEGEQLLYQPPNKNVVYTDVESIKQRQLYFKQRDLEFNKRQSYFNNLNNWKEHTGYMLYPMDGFYHNDTPKSVIIKYGNKKRIFKKYFFKRNGYIFEYIFHKKQKTFYRIDTEGKCSLLFLSDYDELDGYEEPKPFEFNQFLFENDYFTQDLQNLSLYQY
jgi:hypothetical protein